MLEPANEQVLVLDMPDDAKLDGIELPGNMRQREMRFGTVISTGPLVSQWTKQRDQVCYGPYAGMMIIVGGTEFRLLKEGQIAGYLRSEVKNESNQDATV